jgi:hypothetical protein
VAIQSEPRYNRGVTTRVDLLGACAITALVVGSGFTEAAAPNSPTNVARVPLGSLAEFQKARPAAQCQITHARDYRRDPAGPPESGREQYDLERGTVTTTRPVTFHATCEEPMSGKEVGHVLSSWKVTRHSSPVRVSPSTGRTI